MWYIVKDLVDRVQVAFLLWRLHRRRSLVLGALDPALVRVPIPNRRFKA